jgi:hypothetical protein
MYLRNLKMLEIRAFREANIDLLYPGRQHDDGYGNFLSWPPRLPNVNILLGVNGAGKSTILRAAAMVILSPLITTSGSGFPPLTLIRRSNRTTLPSATIQAELMLHEQDGGTAVADGEVRERLETVITRRADTEIIGRQQEYGTVWNRMFGETNRAFLLVGYGATRTVETGPAQDQSSLRRARSLRYQRVASLFEDHYMLRPLNIWLRNMRSNNKRRFKQIVRLIDHLTPSGISFKGDMENGEFLFRHRSVSVPFGALSDGYKAYIGWVADLLFHLSTGTVGKTKLTDSHGIVLVDEIDLHIHPEWQRTIVPRLAQTLKNLQFIFTTHSPLVVGTLERANIFTVETGKNGLATLKRPDAEMFGLSADQILRSDTFGLDSTRDVEFQAHLQRLSRDASAGKPGATIQLMREAAIGQGGALSDEATVPEWLRKLSGQRTAKQDDPPRIFEPPGPGGPDRLV